MFDNIKEAITYIESKRTKRTFLDFKRIIEKYKFNTNLKNVIHVAGTNGKGSTTILMRDLLMKHGYSVGTFTSPYIINHNERISVNGQSISDQKLLQIINELYEMIEIENLSMFEIDVCIMLHYFNELKLDYHIIECGIGGLTDKTNVINSQVAVITSIGYDHQFMLGNTLLEIAQHKAGIIKKRKPLFTTEQNQDVIALFQKECDIKKSDLHLVDVVKSKEYPYHILFKGKDYTLCQPGYQVNNFTLALHVVGYLITIDDNLIQDIIDHFYWPCRFEKIGHIYLDGAHNIDGIRSLVQTLNEQKIKDVGIVFSALNDKDIDDMLQLLKDYDVIFACFDDERSNQNHICFQDAIQQMATKHRNVVVTGSLHFVSTVRKYVLSA